MVLYWVKTSQTKWKCWHFAFHCSAKLVGVADCNLFVVCWKLHLWFGKRRKVRTLLFLMLSFTFQHYLFLFSLTLLLNSTYFFKGLDYRVLPSNLQSTLSVTGLSTGLVLFFSSLFFFLLNNSLKSSFCILPLFYYEEENSFYPL